MKKMISILLAVMMLLAVAVAAAESEEIPQPENGKKFDTSWAIPGGRADIYYEEEGYRIHLAIDKDMTETVWEYSCYYVEEEDALVSISSSKSIYAISAETGEAEVQSVEYEGLDEEGQETVFTVDEHGHLVWKDGHEDAGAGLEFVNIGRFEGIWRNEEAEVEVEFKWNGFEDEMFYTVYILRGKTDADTYASFLMNGEYDPATGKMSCFGTCTLFTRNANGDYDSSEDGESYDAFFSLMDDGRLLFETENGIELEYDLLGSNG